MALAIALVLLPAIGGFVLVRIGRGRAVGGLRGLVLAFIFGAVAAIPAGIVKAVIAHYSGRLSLLETSAGAKPDWVASLLYLIIGVGLVEESVKLLAVRLGAFSVVQGLRRAGVATMVLYAITAALGFATLEDILYVIAAPGLEATYATAVMRLLTTPTHPVLALLWAVPLAHRGPYRGIRIMAGLLLAALLHGLYDFLALGAADAAPGIAFLMVIGAFAGVIALTWATRRTWLSALTLLRTPPPAPVVPIQPGPRACSTCGALALLPEAQYCHMCGTGFPFRYCMQCREGLRETARFCTNCGQAVRTLAPAVALLEEPSELEPLMQETAGPGKVIPLWRILFLGILSAGLYYFYWLGVSWKHLADETSGRALRPVWHTIATLVPVYGLFVLYDHFIAIERAQKRAGISTDLIMPTLAPVTGIGIAALFAAAVFIHRHPTDTYVYFGLATLLYICLPLYGQLHLNRLWNRVGQQTERPAPWGVAEGLVTLMGAVAFTLFFVSAALDRPFIASVSETQPKGVVSVDADRTDTLADPSKPHSYAFSAVQGNFYLLETKPTSDGLEDPALSIWSEDGLRLLAYNDDGLLTKMARIEWTAPATGLYYVVVESADGVSQGAYTLAVTHVHGPQAGFGTIWQAAVCPPVGARWRTSFRKPNAWRRRSVPSHYARS